MRSCSTAGSAADPDTSRRARPQRARDRVVALGVGGQAVVHRRHAEDHRRAVPRAPRRRPPTRSARGDASRRRGGAGPSTPSTRPWTWKSGRPCATTSSAGPLPGVGEGVEVRRDRAARQDGALGRAGGARGVDDQGRRLLVRLVRELAAARVEVDLDARPLRQRLGQLDAGRAQDRLGRGVVDDVAELALARLGVDGHDGDPGQQRADDGHARLGRRHRPHADALGARDLLGHVRGRVAQLRVAERRPRRSAGRGGRRGLRARGRARQGSFHACTSQRSPPSAAPRSCSLAERPDPAPAPGEVVVRIRAANVNPTDLGVRSGQARTRHARPAAAVRAGLGPGRRGDRGGQRGGRLRARAIAWWG